MRQNKISSLLAPIRLRYLFFVTIIIGSLFFSLTYWGIKQARQSLLNIMVQEGRALTQSLILSSNNAIQAELLLESLSETKFAEIAESAKNKLGRVSESRELHQFCRDYDLLSIDILDTSLSIIASNRWAIGFIPEYPNEVQVEIIETMRQGGGYRTVLSYSDDSIQTVTQYFIYEFASDEQIIPGSRIMVLASDAGYIDQIMRQIGTGYLIKEISNQAGIEYIFLQTRDGIIFSSRPLSPILKIESDVFLSGLMDTDSVGWRMHELAGLEVMEIARKFESVAYPPGVFRIGLNLDEFNELSRGYDRQIIVIAVILFLLTLLVVAVVSINQNYFILDKSFKQIQSMSDSIFDRLTSAVLAYDADGRILAVNSAFCQWAGLSHDIIGKELKTITDSLPFTIPQPDQIGESEIGFETDIELPDGEKRSVLIGSSRLPDEAGGGSVMLLYDITDRKRLEQDNRQKERLSEMGDMAAGVAHEIRNPLNAIGIAAQRLQIEYLPEKDGDEYTQLTINILAETSRLNDILTRFLELAKTRSAKQRPVDIIRAIDKAVTSLRDEAGQNNVTIKFDSPQPMMVRGEVEKYQQVFINLIKNSIQAMDAGGEITIKAESDAANVTLSVSDNGSGFPADSMTKIFQPYFTTKTDGSGLGLALAYKTITDFGGSISAANNPDGGASIFIKIPLMK